MVQEKNAALTNSSTSIYAPAGFFLVRAPALPAEVATHLLELPAQNVEGADLDMLLTQARQQSYERVRTLLDEPLVEQALTIASRDIAEGIKRIRSGETVPRRLERAYASVFRYLLRMATRPTPFGLFAGVALGYLGETTNLRLGNPALGTIRTRPDMYWLLSLIQKIEADQNLRHQLHVVVNRTAYIAGGRVILSVADIYGKYDHRSIALRATPVVRFVLEHAKEPIPYLKLRAALLETFASANERQVDGLLEQLWEHHILMSTLRPPLTSADPARYLLEQMSKIPDAVPMRQQLQEILTLATKIDQVGPGGSLALISELTTLQQALLSTEKLEKRPYQIDASLRLEKKDIHHALGEAVAQATETLLRLTRVPRGSTHLREYYQAFIERYGMDAEVPLLELLSPESGLDAPTGYQEPARTYPFFQPPEMIRQEVNRREAMDKQLYNWLSEALATGAEEIELTDKDIQKLTQWTPETGLPPAPIMELYIQVQAPSYEAINQGKWRAVVAPACMTYGGRTFCRFFDILGTEMLETLQSYTRCEDVTDPKTIYAELSYLPTSGYGANVAIRPALYNYEIIVNTTPSVPPERVILLDDLVVGVEKGNFYFRSLRLSKRVIATQSHMLNPHNAPNVCRFLLEVSWSIHPGNTDFVWGLARGAPFLPRVVRKQVVLNPAQWNLRPSQIEVDPGQPGSEEARWYTALQNWRKRWHVPRYVYFGFLDNRLLLDLEHPLSLAELRKELKKVGEQGSVRLEEMLPSFEDLWLQDTANRPYFAELVVPLSLRQPEERPKPTPQSTHISSYPRAIRAHERRKLPGEEWTYLKLYAPAKQHDEIITRAVRECVRRMYAQGLIERWFYLRYADPEPHLRLRLYTPDPQKREKVVLTALAWSREVADYGLIERVCVDTYVRETERYGGPEAIDLVEQVFTANSSAICSVVAAVYQQKLQIDPLATAVFSLDQFFGEWGLDFEARLRYLRRQVQGEHIHAALRKQRRLFCELLSPWDPDYDPTLSQQRALLQCLLADQYPVLKEVGRSIRHLAFQERLWQPEEAILASLAHMHLNRLLGINPEREQKIYAIWRYTLESIQRRPARKGT